MPCILEIIVPNNHRTHSGRVNVPVTSQRHQVTSHYPPDDVTQYSVSSAALSLSVTRDLRDG